MDEPKSSSQGADSGDEQDRPLAWTRILSKQARKREYKYLGEDEGHAPSPIPITIDKPSPIGWDRVIELVLTAVIAYASSVQLYTVIENNKTTSNQAERLLQSANRIDDAADSFSSSASHINGGISEAVAQLQAQVKALDNARNASESASQRALQTTIDNFHEEQRPWVGIQGIQCECTMKMGEPQRVGNKATLEQTLNIGSLDGILVNTGRTPAVRTHFRYASDFDAHPGDPIPTYETAISKEKANLAQMPERMRIEAENSMEEAERKIFPLVTIPPNTNHPAHLTRGIAIGRNMFAPDNEKRIIYVVGEITYYDPDTPTQHITTFCLVNENWFPGSESFSFCPTGNDMK